MKSPGSRRPRARAMVGLLMVSRLALSITLALAGAVSAQAPYTASQQIRGATAKVSVVADPALAPAAARAANFGPSSEVATQNHGTASVTF